jgi:hypothetical protein
MSALCVQQYIVTNTGFQQNSRRQMDIVDQTNELLLTSSRIYLIRLRLDAGTRDG